MITKWCNAYGAGTIKLSHHHHTIPHQNWWWLGWCCRLRRINLFTYDLLISTVMSIDCCQRRWMGVNGKNILRWQPFALEMENTSGVAWRLYQMLTPAVEISRWIIIFKIFNTDCLIVGFGSMFKSFYEILL